MCCSSVGWWFLALFFPNVSGKKLIRQKAFIAVTSKRLPPLRTVIRPLCKLTKQYIFCMLPWYFFFDLKTNSAMSFHYLRNTLSLRDYLVSAELWCGCDKKDFTRVTSDLSNIWPPLSLGLKSEWWEISCPRRNLGKGRWLLHDYIVREDLTEVINNWFCASGNDPSAKSSNSGRTNVFFLAVVPCLLFPVSFVAGKSPKISNRTLKFHSFG